MINKYKVYLAGPITGLNWKESQGWRDIVAEKVSRYVDTYSPLRGKEFLGTASAIADHYEDVMASVKGINTRDYTDVITSDAILVNFLGAKRISIGTVMEIAWAKQAQVPVIAIMEKDNIHHHAMLDYACGFIVETLEEGIEVLQTVLLSDGQLANLRASQNYEGADMVFRGEAQ